MAVKLVLTGIAAGLAATAGVLALGGGIGLAVLAYIGGGMMGMIGGLVAVLSPRHHVAIPLEADDPRLHPRPAGTRRLHG
jgi:hypothetical protein